MLIEVSQNNYSHVISDILENSDGSPFNLTGYTVNFVLWHPSFPQYILVNNAASVVTPASGTVQYSVQKADFPQVGTFSQQWIATPISGSGTISFPVVPNTVTVEESA
jgi:hypothetical protein